MSDTRESSHRLWLFTLLTGLPSLTLWLLAYLFRDSSVSSAITISAVMVTSLLMTTLASIIHEAARRPGAGPVIQSLEKVRQIVADETEKAGSFRGSGPENQNDRARLP